MTSLGVSIETEQELLSIVSEFNASYWAGEKTDKQKEIIKKYGSESAAQQATFTIFWNGMTSAIKNLDTKPI